jgi:hypothetical protein
MSTHKFVHDDLVKVTPTGQIGTVKEVHQVENGYLYGVQVRDAAAEHIHVPEAELELVKIANADETGFHMRYIT